MVFSIHKTACLTESHAALQIQKAWRAYRVRFYRTTDGRLSDDLLAQGKFCVDHGLEEDTTYALEGRARVGFPKRFPRIVVKVCEHASARFIFMQRMHRTLRKAGFTHLICPHAASYRETLIETRLPIAQTREEQFKLYEQNQQLFTPAVIELTHLTCMYYKPIDIYPARYDNLPVYLKSHEGSMIGCIGLIDLEGWQPLDAPLATDYTLTSLVALFPYHLQQIIDTASRYKDLSPTKIQELKSTQVEALREKRTSSGRGPF